MRIKVLGGTGYGGAGVVREAKKRGHSVTSYSRRPPENPVEAVDHITGTLLDPSLRAGAVRDADVVFLAVSQRRGMQGEVEGLLARLMQEAATAGVRLGVLGGVSSVLVSENGPRWFAVVETPDEFLPEVETGIALLDALRDSPSELDWFYVSPALEFGARFPPRVTGTYRISDDVLLRDQNGQSYISADDLAVAVLDEMELPRYRRRRFHVAL